MTDGEEVAGRPPSCARRQPVVRWPFGFPRPLIGLLKPLTAPFTFTIPTVSVASGPSRRLAAAPDRCLDRARASASSSPLVG